jgi:hypothetical protein
MVGNPATAHDNYAIDMREIKEMPSRVAISPATHM